MAINLSKGQRISLEKSDGDTLNYIELGVNWGAIEKKGLLGFGKRHVAVDLDASIGMFDAQGTLVDAVWFNKLRSQCGSIQHSGDDRVGDVNGDDGQDNEVIQIDLKAVPPQVETLALVLNSFTMQNFGEIPFAGVRIHEGKNGKGSVFATFDIANDPSFAGRVSMILGSVYRHNGSWKFRSIGEAIPEQQLQATLEAFARDYIGG